MPLDERGTRVGGKYGNDEMIDDDGFQECNLMQHCD
jgi:hypothetical protein